MARRMGRQGRQAFKSGRRPLAPADVQPSPQGQGLQGRQQRQFKRIKQNMGNKQAQNYRENHIQGQPNLNYKQRSRIRDLRQSGNRKQAKRLKSKILGRQGPGANLPAEQPPEGELAPPQQTTRPLMPTAGDGGFLADIGRPDIDFSDPNSVAAGQEDYGDRASEKDVGYNRFDEEGPYGSARWVRNPDGTFTRVVSLDETEQAKKDQQGQFQTGVGDFMNQQLGGVRDRLGQDFNLEGLPEAPGPGERKRFEEQLYGQYSRDIESNYKRETDQFDQEMANRGVPVGSAEYKHRRQQLEDKFSRARQDAKSQAFQDAGTEFERSYRIGEDQRGRRLSERELMRDRPLQEMGAIGQFQQGVNTPQYSQASRIGVQPVDAAGIGLGYGGLNLQQKQLLENIRQFNKGFKLNKKQFKEGQRQFDANLNFQREQAAQALALAGSHGGGGGGGPSQSQIDQEYLNLIANSFGGGGGGGGGSDPWAQIAAAFGGAAASGAGQAAAGYFF